jgi:hypothetical protein
MSDPTSQLEATLEEILQILGSHGEQHWYDWLSGDLALIRAGDLNGVDHLLSAYGRMGSFTDLWLCPENGHRIEKSAVTAINEILERLSSQAWSLARGIRRAV